MRSSAALRPISPVGSRANVVRTARYTVIDDCYNANPDSTAAALRSMATLPAGRRVAILGNMGELGPDAAALHRETGVCAARAGVSLVITCGALAKNIAAGAAEADPNVQTASFGRARRAARGAAGAGAAGRLRARQGVAQHGV